MSDTTVVDRNADFRPPVPAAVRAAAKLADDLFKQANPTPADPADPPVADPPTADPPAADLPPADPLAADPPPDPATWEQRYRTLEGKYQRELPDAIARARAAETKITDLEAVIASMRTASPAPTTVVTDVPDDDVEQYGGDLVAAARRWARAEIAPEIAQLKADLEKITGTVKGTSQEVVKERTNNALDAALPGWRDTNRSAEFIAWLQQNDPFAGVRRQDMLVSAYEAGHVARVLAFFNAFAQEHTVTTQAPGTQSPHTPDPGAGRLPLDTLAAPGRTRPASGSGAPAEDQYFTNAEVAAFYQDVAKGKFAHDEAGKLRWENAIIAAARAGRVR